MNGRWRLGAVGMALLALCGCATDNRAPIEQKNALPSSPAATRPAPARPALDEARGTRQLQPPPATHVVAPGDKLLTIAWRYGLDVRDLARWNDIDNPDLIVVGRTLKLRPPAPPPAPAQAPRMVPAPTSPATVTSGPRLPPGATSLPAPAVAATPAASSSASRSPAPPPTPTRVDVPDATSVADAKVEAAPADTPGARGASVTRDGVRWSWPAQGKVSAAATGAVNAGIDIRGVRGSAVRAAAGGAVVYSGSGLRGYGELIIIKHNDTFLSAYAHNEARLVKEGHHVAAGDPIARMGNSDTADVMLHFEIRRNGKAVDPLQYLPSR
ncbi:MAG: peptidoglycan DD-metalloendopeptidase family protein [Gammaproteobacteria bacterium]